MKIIIACDHAGYELKEYLKEHLTTLNHEVVDMGAHTHDENDDYPDTIAPAARAVSESSDTLRAIIIGGSGQGEAIVANRFPNVRAVVYAGEVAANDSGVADMITLTREHNDANVLSLGARFMTQEKAGQAVVQWLETLFSGDERHVRRIQKIETVTQ